MDTVLQNTGTIVLNVGTGLYGDQTHIIIKYRKGYKDLNLFYQIKMVIHMSRHTSNISFSNGLPRTHTMARIDVIMGAIRQMREWNPGMESMMQRVVDKMSLYVCSIDFARYVLESLVRERGLLIAMDTALEGDAE